MNEQFISRSIVLINIFQIVECNEKKIHFHFPTNTNAAELERNVVIVVVRIHIHYTHAIDSKSIYSVCLFVCLHVRSHRSSEYPRDRITTRRNRIASSVVGNK